MHKCPKCGQSYYSEATFESHFKYSHPSDYRKMKEHHEESSSGGDFTTSVLIGYATNSALLGGLIGGDIVGGIVGDLLNDSGDGGFGGGFGGD